MGRSREMKGVILMGMMVLMLTVCSSATSNDDQQQQKWWKRMFQGSTSSSLVNPVGSSSVVLPLNGNIYPMGYYYVEMNIGKPPKPYFLDPDTGSDLTWLQCDAPCVHCTKGPHPLYRPNNDLVLCKDPICAAVHEGEHHKCEDEEAADDQCDYEVEYADGGSSLGVLVNDVFRLNFTTGVRHTSPLALGCGYDQIPGANYHPLDGVLGLGKGKSSIISQLRGEGLVRNVVGHCFGGKGGGFIFFGDDVYDSSRVVWTPMSRDHRSKHYSPGFAELLLGGRSSGLKNLLMVFDSGSSYTYLNSHTYQTLLSFVKKELSGKPLKEAVDDRTLPFCWKGKKPFKSIREVKKYFKPLALSFTNGWRDKPQFEIPPEAYLIISSKGSVCLGVLNGTEVGLHSFNIIGDITMQDKMVIYDNEKQAIGWLPANCERIPNPNHISV